MSAAFSRELLSGIMPAVWRAGGRYKDAWVWTQDRKTWEFHGPHNYHWYGRADDAYHARYKGWQAWLAEQEKK